MLSGLCVLVRDSQNIFNITLAAHINYNPANINEAADDNPVRRLPKSVRPITSLNYVEEEG